MTAFESIKIKNLIAILDDLDLSEMELRTIKAEIHNRIVNAVIKRGFYGWKDDLRGERKRRKKVKSFKLSRRKKANKTAGV